MRITMVKKRLANGEPCKKCAQAEELLRKRGLFERIDEVVWADESAPDSPGNLLAAEHGIELAPFFLVEHEGRTTPYTSVLRLVGDVLAPTRDGAPGALAGTPSVDVAALARELAERSPQEILLRALDLFGSDCAIAFSGAEDVALIDMAVQSRRPFSVVTLDTGRLHPETYRFLDRVRAHYGIEIAVAFPEPLAVERLVRQKGLFSFYVDGHEECCAIRKVEPLARALAGRRAWMTGQRRDQSPTRSEVPVVSLDALRGEGGAALVKWNPLARWTLAEVWEYVRDHGVPYNALHDQGFVSIGCEPCTRAVRPGEHERAGRWWWEEATKRECGLHVQKG